MSAVLDFTRYAPQPPAPRIHTDRDDLAEFIDIARESLWIVWRCLCAVIRLSARLSLGWLRRHAERLVVSPAFCMFGWGACICGWAGFISSMIFFS